MSKLKRIFPVFAILSLLIFVNPTYGQVSVAPIGFGASLEVNAEANAEMILINDGDNPVTYNISYDLIEDEERRGGPRRDDLGEEIGGLQVENGSWFGLTWDGEWMWGITYSDSRVIAYDMDNEIQAQFQAQHRSCTGLTWDGETFWTAGPGQLLVRFDIEGNTIDQINVRGNLPRGVTWDGEALWYTNLSAPYYCQRVSVEGELLRDINIEGINNTRMSCVWVEGHRDGHLWIHHTDGPLYQLNVEEDDPEIIQEVQLHEGGNRWGIDHDGEHLWYPTQERWIQFDDGVAEFFMLGFEPFEGVIPPGEDIPVEIFITTAGVEAGVYNILVEIELEELEEIIEFTAIITVDSPSANILCSVTDAATDEAVPDVTVDVYKYSYTRFTNNAGRCEFEELPVGEYEFTFTATDYLPLVEPYQIDGEGELNLDVELLHAQCNLDLEEIVDALDAGAQSETILTVTNDGNGPLTFTTDRRLLGDANAEPWEHRVGVPAGIVAEDPRVHGAVFINDHFYASGANDGEAAIYVLNRDQELVNQFAQLGESRYGYKDLASDGETIWGSGERIVFEFTPDGEEVSTFDCGISPCNNLAWDSDRDILWVSGTTTDIIGFDREGNQVGEVDRQNLRIYGLAYWPDDPDGYQLYVYHKINDVGNLLVAKFDIENDQVMDVANLQHENGGVAQGCYITNQYDIYSWVFMGTANSGAEDRVDIWQLDARKDWMGIEPTNGTIEGGEAQEFVVTLDATGLPQAPFEGEIVFTHDGVGGESRLPITLQVGEGQGGGPEEMVLELANGWNMVSVYVQPDPDDVVEIMTDLVEAESLIMVKNGSGQFYNPQFGFNNIPGWLVEEGYMIKMDGADDLTLAGEPVPWDHAIELDPGWQMISFYPRQGVEAILALSGIVDVLLMAKDGAGRFYSPAFGFSNMGDMVAGMGYLLKMDEATELIYTVEEEVAHQSRPMMLPKFVPSHKNTSENMSLLVLTDLSEGEIGVFSNNEFVGSGVIQDGRCGIAVWGDDPTTPIIDGSLENDPFTLEYFNSGKNCTIQFDLIKGNGRYDTDDFQVVYLKDLEITPDQFGITTAYPNPFNSRSVVEYSLPQASLIDVALFDLNGRKVLQLVEGFIQAGQYSVTIDGSDLASGIYILQLQAGKIESKQKVTLIR